MSLLAALCAGVFAYLFVGFVTGQAPTLALGSLRGTRTDLGRNRVWLAQAGLRVSPSQFFLSSMGAAVATFAVVVLITGSVGVAAVPAILMGLLPKAYYSRLRVRRLREVQEAWPDGIHELVANIAAGRSLTQAIAEFARRGPPALRKAFARFPFLTGAVGTGPALEVIREELADPLSDRVIEVLILANEQGGHTIIQILRDLGQAAANDRKAMEEVKTNQLEQRINAWAVSAMPWAVLLLLTARRGHFRDFYRSPPGLVVVAVGGVLTLLGLLWMNRLGREPIEQRVFGGRSPHRRGAER